MANHDEVNDSKLNSLTWANYFSVAFLLTVRLREQSLSLPSFTTPMVIMISPLNVVLAMPSVMRTASIYLPSPITQLYDVMVYQQLRQIASNRYIRYINAISNINIPHELSQLIPYAEPVLAPDNWYLDVQNTVVDRVLVTAGKRNRLFDQIEDGGIHDDIIMDFEIAEAPLRNELTPVVLDWMAQGFRM
ncbi:hypothetical protein DFJ43DRAFT_1160056 [Lentinula guzmanii]|uniref:Uncharacterized protein n=1 Tax=Lentinula guzmanii TaxID=2804957 RepID=A0AA38JB30_9AGAR|nr:hypothetical protein DFJ43DRAFT_1160056 [Lentinula guzmanii]